MFKRLVIVSFLSLLAITVVSSSALSKIAEISTHRELAARHLVIDLHCDTVYRFYRLGNKISPFTGNKLHVTLGGLKRAGARGQVFAAWVPPGKGYNHANHLIDLFEKMLEKHSDDMAFAGSYADLKKNLADGKISAFLGIEGGKAIDEDLGKIDHFYKRGVRYMTITWSHNNKIADSSGSSKKRYGGLSDFGEKVVRKMNDIGMIVDVSHASDDAVRHVLRTTADPVIASHSNCHSVWRHPRNLKDDLIEGICGGGGVIGVNYYSKFLGPKNKATVRDVADHIDYLVKVGGIDCAALGSDYDGMTRPARGLENIGKLENLTDELFRRGYKAEDIVKIYGMNFVRVLYNVVGK